MATPPLTSASYDSSSEDWMSLSDSEESLDGDSFDWDTMRLGENDTDDFLPWLLDPDYEPAEKRRMNCAQGVIVYIDQFDGGQLAEEVREHYFHLKRTTGDSDKARYVLYTNLSPFLGLDEAEGPFDLNKVDEVWQSTIVRPGSVISFGNNSDNVHVAIVTKRKQEMRSLWVSPIDDTQAPFGKYPYTVVFDDVQSFLVEQTDEKRAELGASDVFYVSNRFCPIFEESGE